MQIFIQHQGQQTGPFTIAQVHAGLIAGTYLPTDMAWYEGAAGWAALSTVPGVVAGANGIPAAASTDQKTSGLAITSLVLGILALPTAGLTAIPAVICGHIARGKIKRSAGTQSGGGLALAGLICGYFGFVIVGIAMLAGLSAPLIIRQRKKADQTEAVSNARGIGLALYEFKTEYGAFPDDETAAKVAAATETEIVKGTSSNARFRQLIRAGISQSETIFYAKTAGTHKPDNSFLGEDCLETGECGFAYVGNLLTSDETRRPLAMTPFVPGTHRFDDHPFDGKAVILWTDNSVTSLPIDRATGEIMVDGKNLLDPQHPIWGGQAPVIALPE